MEKPTNYLVEIKSKEEQYYWTSLTHLYETHSIERANKKSEDIIKIAMSLKVYPQRGRLEEDLAVYNKEFRALIYHVTKRNTVKIIYFIDKVTKTVTLPIFSKLAKIPMRKQNEIKSTMKSCRTKNK